jgi:hypothetical protein
MYKDAYSAPTDSYARTCAYISEGERLATLEASAREEEKNLFHERS